MTEELKNQLKPLLGKKCCKVRVWSFRSLSLGFGKKIYHHNPRLVDTYKGEWEIGSYSCAWRIMKNKRILAGKNDPEDNYEAFTEKLRRIEFGRIISIDQFNSLDVRLSFDSGIVIDFLATISDNDEYLHVFCPDNLCVVLSRGGKWTIEKSNKPSKPRVIS